ncbi:MAG: c-type cytochrome [Polymorphobacter sp.]
MRALLLLPLLAGCSSPPPSPPPSPAQIAAFAASAVPGDARLAALYSQSCKTCHADAASGAPLVGNAAAWAPRLAQGPDALLASVISGKNAMPAGGQCFTCTAEDFKALTRFMSAAKPQ